jgi:hypothetical protein
MDPKKHDLEDFALWGLKPALVLAKYIEDEVYSGPAADQDSIEVMINEVQLKIEDMTEALTQHSIYVCKLKNRLKELSPDDPLLKDEEEGSRDQS